MKKTIVIGLDGANWELLAPWLKDGLLPNLSYLKRKGAWGEHKSELPPVTFPNWKCYSTGKNPGKLGVYWWERVDFKNRKIEIPDSKDFKSKEIWDYMSENNLKVGVINMPGTYPPKKVNGFMISGGPDSLEKHYTYPEALENKPLKQFGYRVHPKNKILSRENIEKNLDEILKLIESRFKVAEKMLPQIDFLHLTIFYINALQHYFWRGEPVKKVWQAIDKNLATFINPQYTLILVSDHGCKKTDLTFYVNSWLEKEGYLKTKKKKFFLRPSKEKVAGLLQRFGLSPLVKLVPQRIKKSLPSAIGTINKKGKQYIIDWEKSSALGSGQGLIYLNPAEKKSYENLREEIIKKLENLSFNGKKIAKKVYKKESVYKGPYLDLAPDIVFEQIPGVHTSGGIGKAEIFESPPQKWEAENIREGIFLAYGPNIKEKYKCNKVRIIDFAPTILSLLGIPLPPDIDGKSLDEIFVDKNLLPQKGVAPKKDNKEKTDTQKESKYENEVKKRLKDLGYL